MNRRITGIILCLCMILSILPFGAVPVMAEDSSTSGNWQDSGNYDISWYDGISATTYEISTPEQLAGLAYLVNNAKASFDGATVKITSDIDLEAHFWTPIDNAGLPDAPIFAGTFDGDGHTISNMTIEGSWRENGLFGRCDGYIQNVVMNNAEVEVPYGTKDNSVSAGILCGMLYSCTNARPAASIKNCTVKNSVIRNSTGVNAGFIVANKGGNPKPIVENVNESENNQMDYFDFYDKILVKDFLDNKLGKTIEVYDELDYLALLQLSSTGVDFKGYTIKLMADLDMSALNWASFKKFAGTFEGNNYAIVGLNSETNIAGLVDTARTGCKIRNLSLYVDLANGCAAFINNISNASVEMENCKAYGNIHSNLTGLYAGGIIARVVNSTVKISGCENYIDLISRSCGGIVGFLDCSDATIERCVNFGSMTANSSGSTARGAGGIVGEVLVIRSAPTYNINISECSVPERNLKNEPIVITANGTSEESKAFAGGFVGKLPTGINSTLSIQNSSCNAKLVAKGKGNVYASIWTTAASGTFGDKPILKIAGTCFGGTLLYVDENGKESIDKTRLFLGPYFYNSSGAAKGSKVERNHCVVIHKKDGQNAQNFSSLKFSNKESNMDDPTRFSVEVNNSGTKFRNLSALFDPEYDLVKALNEKSRSENLWTNKNNFQSGLPYLNTTPNVYELANISPIGAGALKITSVADCEKAGKTEYYKFPSEANPTVDAKNGFTLQLQTAYAKTKNARFYDEYLVFINEKKKATPLVAGDVITMYTLSTDKETVTGTYTCTVSDEDIRDDDKTFAGGVLIRFTKFKDKNGNAYTGSPDEIRSMYFTVDFAGSGARAAEGEYSVIYELVTHSSELGYRACVKKSVKFQLVHEYDIELSAGTAENGTISFYNNENTGRSVGSGVMTIISPKEGYQVEEAWITDDNDTVGTKTPLDGKYNFSDQGFNFVWKTPGKYTVHATFEPKKFSVTFEGEHCRIIGENTVIYGNDYSFSIEYDEGYSAVGENPVTVNGQAVTANASGEYTVQDNRDAVRIKVNTKTKTDPVLSVKSDVTSLTYGESVTLTATLKEGGTALSNKTVKFYDGTTLAGSGKTDENGNAAYTLARPTASTHTFKAVFSGDNDYNDTFATTEDVTVLKKMLTVSVEPVVIDQGEPLPTLTVKVSDGFVSGENSGMLTGFALPNASADGTVETLNTGLKSFAVTFAGGNPTGNYRFDLSQTTVSITINPVSADYSNVDAAIAMIPEDLSVYTEETVNALNDAKNAVVRDKNITEQTTVDGYAAAIENAINGLTYKGADYSKVDAALAKIPADLSVYTDATVKVLNDAKNAVVRDKNITEQTTVDGYAADIENAIAALEKKTVTPVAPQTGDNSNMLLWIALMFISFGEIATTCVVKRKRVRSK